MVKTLCLLLIEDDAVDAEFVKRAMRSLSMPYSLAWETDLKSALASTKNQVFDAILCDLSLPDSMGVHTVSQLLASVSETPLVVLTSSNDPELAEKILNAGAQDYIPKQAITGDVLGRAIRHAIQRQTHLTETKTLVRDISTARELLSSKNKKLETLYKQAHDFVDNVSHEFRTPLTVIKEYSSLVREGFAGDVNKEQIHMLDIIENRVDDLNTMVDDMLDSSKLESGLIGAWRKPCDVQQILGRVTAAMERKAEIKKVHMTWDISDDLPLLFCDAEKIGRVLINLGVNALKFCGTPGEVHLAVKYNDIDSDVVFSVSDNGPGIESSNLTQIFARFHQLGAAAHNSCKGFGLGLAIAKELVELNFGRLTVTSTLGLGSTFSFTVPIYDTEVVTRRYIDMIKRNEACTNLVTLVSVHVGCDTNCESMIASEEFLHSVCRWNDLLFRCADNSLLLLLATDESELNAFVDRAHDLWQSSNRNSPRGALPEINYQHLGTWQVEIDSDSLLTQLALAVSDRQVSYA